MLVWFGDVMGIFGKITITLTVIIHSLSSFIYSFTIFKLLETNIFFANIFYHLTYASTKINIYRNTITSFENQFYLSTCQVSVSFKLKKQLSTSKQNSSCQFLTSKQSRFPLSLCRAQSSIQSYHHQHAV